MVSGVREVVIVVGYVMMVVDNLCSSSVKELRRLLRNGSRDTGITRVGEVEIVDLRGTGESYTIEDAMAPGGEPSDSTLSVLKPLSIQELACNKGSELERACDGATLE